MWGKVEGWPTRSMTGLSGGARKNPRKEIWQVCGPHFLDQLRFREVYLFIQGHKATQCPNEAESHIFSLWTQKDFHNIVELDIVYVAKG